MACRTGNTHCEPANRKAHSMGVPLTFASKADCRCESLKHEPYMIV